MEKKIAGPLLLSAIALATILASAVPSLYAFSNAAQILVSAAPSLYDFSKSAQTPTVADEGNRPFVGELRNPLVRRKGIVKRAVRAHAQRPLELALLEECVALLAALARGLGPGRRLLSRDLDCDVLSHSTF